MAGPLVQESFTTSSSNGNAGVASDVLVVPTGMTAMRLTITGLDASNTVKTQKRTAGGTWSDQTTYNSNQSNTSVTVATGEEWRLVSITQQSQRTVQYKLSCEN